MDIKDEIPDAYADKARVLWASLRGTDFHDGRNRIAAALRESAAEAFEEAAKRAARSISDGSEAVEELPNELEVKAAMLRAAPPRAAGERNKI
jgi:hypothetical protein